MRLDGEFLVPLILHRDYAPLLELGFGDHPRGPGLDLGRVDPRIHLADLVANEIERAFVQRAIVTSNPDLPAHGGAVSLDVAVEGDELPEPRNGLDTARETHARPVRVLDCHDVTWDDQHLGHRQREGNDLALEFVRDQLIATITQCLPSSGGADCLNLNLFAAEAFD